MICVSCKNLWKFEELLLEDEKIVLTLNYFFTPSSFFDAEDSLHDFIDGAARILGKEGADKCFIFKVDTLLDAEGKHYVPFSKEDRC